MIMSKAICRIYAYNKGIFSFLLLVFVFLSHADISAHTNEYVYQIPKKLNDGWEISSISDEGIDKEAIEEISREIAGGDSGVNTLVRKTFEAVIQD